MFEMMHNSGWGAYGTLAMTLVGAFVCVTIGRKIGRPGSVAGCFAVAALAMAAMGFGSGQVMVESHATAAATDLGQQLAMVNIGTMEASQNMLFGGLCALALLMLGGGLALSQLRREHVAELEPTAARVTVSAQ